MLCHSDLVLSSDRGPIGFDDASCRWPLAGRPLFDYSWPVASP